MNGWGRIGDSRRSARATLVRFPSLCHELLRAYEKAELVRYITESSPDSMARVCSYGARHSGSSISTRVLLVCLARRASLANAEEASSAMTSFQLACSGRKALWGGSTFKANSCYYCYVISPNSRFDASPSRLWPRILPLQRSIPPSGCH
jgi:hypothetical protein